MPALWAAGMGLYQFCLRIAANLISAWLILSGKLTGRWQCRRRAGMHYTLTLIGGDVGSEVQVLTSAGIPVHATPPQLATPRQGPKPWPTNLPPAVSAPEYLQPAMAAA